MLLDNCQPSGYSLPLVGLGGFFVICRQNDDVIQYNWFTLMLLCTGAPLVLCCDWFDCGSRQVKCELVDLVTEDYDVSHWQRILPSGLSAPIKKKKLKTCWACQIHNLVVAHNKTCIYTCMWCNQASESEILILKGLSVIASD